MKDILTDIVQDDTRASKVIQQLRNLLKKQELELKVIDVAQLIQETMRFVQSEAVIRGKALIIKCSEASLLVRGDRIQLQQVLLNLISNAFDAVSDPDPRRNEVLIGADRKGDNVVVSVADRGPGISAALKPRLFEPFYTTKLSGLGMGLPISRSIVEAHSGKLSTKNNPDGGAVFYFSLPFAMSTQND